MNECHPQGSSLVVVLVVGLQERVFSSSFPYWLLRRDRGEYLASPFLNHLTLLSSPRKPPGNIFLSISHSFLCIFSACSVFSVFLNFSQRKACWAHTARCPDRDTFTMCGYRWESLWFLQVICLSGESHSTNGFSFVLPAQWTECPVLCPSSGLETFSLTHLSFMCCLSCLLTSPPQLWRHFHKVTSLPGWGHFNFIRHCFDLLND